MLCTKGLFSRLIIFKVLQRIRSKENDIVGTFGKETLKNFSDAKNLLP